MDPRYTLVLGVGGTIHFAVLSKRGINGWTGEPREKFEALLREIETNGELRSVLNMPAVKRRSS